jgi:UDP-N-acetylglucosamine 2-epimerase (non-hydrolysing)
VIKIITIFGTRPEAIKLAPLIKEFQNFPNDFELKICVTGQHRELLDQVLDFFNIKPDFDLNLMKSNQTLFDICVEGLKGLEGVLENYNPDLVVVQGDTTTAFIGALAGFYKKIKIAHIEAGLRSGNKLSPYPEEINRVLISHMADLHFAPTQNAAKNLVNENIRKNIWIVGNTVIDALFLGLKIIEQQNEENYRNFFSFLNFSKKIILVTGHRRESFGKPFENMCIALKQIAERYEDVEIVYPVHLNPNVRKPVYEILQDVEKVHLIEPLAYPYFIWLMKNSYLVLTDSGGIQEEAPSLGKPVLVMRDVTERLEGIKAGTAKLVGTDQQKIINEVSELLTSEKLYKKVAKRNNPYGDGKASKRIKDKILEVCNN